MQEKLISARFSSGRMILAKVGVKCKSVGSKSNSGQRPGVQSPRGKRERSFVLRTYIVGRMGVNKSHILTDG